MRCQIFSQVKEEEGRKKVHCLIPPPPYSIHLKTNVGNEFLLLVDTAFPPSSPLHKLFNIHTLKIIYRYRPNVAKAIFRHNKGLLPKSREAEPPFVTVHTPALWGVNLNGRRWFIRQKYMLETVRSLKPTLH